METVVYRHENKNHRACEIISLDDEYMIRLEGRGGREYFAYFDKNERALEAVKEHLQKYSGLEWHKHGFAFMKYEKGQKPRFRPLVHVLYAAYNPRMKNEDIKKVRYLDGDRSNLRCWNLWHQENAQVEIVDLHGQEYILISYKNRRGELFFAVTDYGCALFEILSSEYLSYQRHNGMFYVGMWQQRQFPITHVVMAHKLYGLTLDDWQEKVAKFRDSLHGGEEMSVDHKKATGALFGRWDNRCKNLQVLSRARNASKGGWTQKLPANCFYIPTEAGALYGRHNDVTGMTEVREMTNAPTATEIDDLRHFCRTGTWNDGEPYNSYPLGSKESMDVIIKELSETRFYQEVLNQL